MNEDTYEAWLAARPAHVRQLAQEFPPLTLVYLNEVKHWVFGYTEDDCLLLAEEDPRSEKGYREALAHPIHVCAAHLRESRRTQ